MAVCRAKGRRRIEKIIAAAHWRAVSTPASRLDWFAMHRPVRLLPSLLQSQRKIWRGWPWIGVLLIVMVLAVIVWRSLRALTGNA